MMKYLEDCPSEEAAMKTSRLNFYLQRFQMQSLFVDFIIKYLGNIAGHLVRLYQIIVIANPFPQSCSRLRMLTLELVFSHTTLAH